MYKYFEKYKSKDTSWALFIKFIYSFGLKTWIHGIISALSGIFTGMLFENGYILWGVVALFITILDIIYASICHSYSKKKFEQRKFAAEILEGESSLINSMFYLMQTTCSWKKDIFKNTSQLVCDRLHETFKSTFSCETRVSVEFAFTKEVKNNEEEYFQMAGRNSNHITTFKNAVKSEKRKKYYSYRVFINNNLGVNVLREADIKNGELWYKNPANTTDVKQYIGIAVSTTDPDKVAFILQIDCLDTMVFGENNSDEDINEFVNQYILTYVNTLKVAYLLGLNKNKKISEVS